MMEKIIDGSWDGKIRIGDIPFILLILIVLPFFWLFEKIENFLDIPIINLKRYKKVSKK